MNNLFKSIFISFYISLLSVVFIQSIIELYQQGIETIWLGIFIGISPSLLFFMKLFIKPVARTSANLNALFIFAGIGAVISYLQLNLPENLTYFYTYNLGLGLGGLSLYVFWYSRLARQDSPALTIGAPLPIFNLVRSEGEDWSSSELTNHAALILFFRGNWCPLCMAQIKEVAASYQQLEQLGVKIYLVSPQPEKFTKSLADKFDVNFNFMTDKINEAAKLLGIESLQGTPKGMEVLGYDSDTVLPTAILTDNNGVIIFTDQTDNYRVRPEPDTFLRVFKEHGLTPQATT